MAKNRRAGPRGPSGSQPRPAVGGPAGHDPALAQAGNAPDPFALVRGQVEPHLQTLEAERHHPVISYYLTDGAQLADEQMLHLYEHLKRLGKQEKISLVLCSRGGATEVPWKIVSLVREFADFFAILLPYRANSAATLTALGADEIVMTEMSELGPVDPSRRHPLLPKDETPEGKKAPLFISVQDLRHVLDFLKREMGEDLTPEAAATVYTALFGHVHPLAIGALEQSWALSIQIAERVLATHMDPQNEKEQIDKIVERLSDHYKSHLYQINRQEARELGLKVADASAAETEAMWALYLANAGMQVVGEGDLQGQKTVVSRIGNIDSSAGTTLGLAHAKASAPGEVLAATWESRWEQAQAPAAAAVPATQTLPPSAPPTAQ